MEAKQVLELLKFIKGAYNRFDINEEMPRVWNEFLKEEPFEMAMQRLKRHIKYSKYEPTISDLLPSKDEREKAHFDHIVSLQKQMEERNDSPADFDS